MATTPIQNIIPEEKIIVFSPHYDDFTLFVGGYVEALKRNRLLDTKQFTSVLIFGRSNYTNNAGPLNLDASLERIKYCTGLRFIEDTECMNELFGRFNYTYECWLEDEAMVRGKVLADDQMEFVSGSSDTLDEYDKKIMDRLIKKISRYALEGNTALLFPIAFKEHIDHYLVREAALQVYEKTKGTSTSSFYFCEDKPYSGLASVEEKMCIRKLVQDWKMEFRVFEHLPERLIDLMFTHYTSQVDENFKIGIRNRAQELMSEHKTDYLCDGIYALRK